MFGMVRKKISFLNKLSNTDIADKINHLKDNLNDGINEKDLSYNVEEFYNILSQVCDPLF